MNRDRISEDNTVVLNNFTWIWVSGVFETFWGVHKNCKIISFLGRGVWGVCFVRICG